MRICVLLWGVLCAVCAGDELPLVLPSAAEDILELRTAEGVRARSLAGLVQDISGDSVVFRRADGGVQVVRLSALRVVRFARSELWEEGLELCVVRRWSEALPKLREALQREARPWALREIRGELAKCQRALGLWQESLSTVEEILESDPETRHVLSLPLIWDERVCEELGVRAELSDLSARSLARQLVAASVLLSAESTRLQSEAALRSLRRSGRGNFGRLAELQLWRLRLLQGGPELLEAESWQQRAGELVREERGAAELQIGRALLRLNEDDGAAISLLWMPLVAPLDPWHCRRAMRDVVEVLERSGRPGDSLRLRGELESLEVSPAGIR
jgi:tetratricopeptide (TPR) repeat protein